MPYIVEGNSGNVLEQAIDTRHIQMCDMRGEGKNGKGITEMLTVRFIAAYAVLSRKIARILDGE